MFNSSVSPTNRASNEDLQRFFNRGKGHIKGWLKEPTSAFTFKTLCLTGVDPMVSRCEIGTPTQMP